MTGSTRAGEGGNAAHGHHDHDHHDHDHRGGNGRDQAVRRSVLRRLGQGPLVAVVALAGAGAFLVTHGEPPPIQRGSGVSVPVATGVSKAPDPLPGLLVSRGTQLTRVAATGTEPIHLPADRAPLTVRQVGISLSAVLAQGPAGTEAYLVPTGDAAVIPLGPAQRVVPGADAASVAVENAGAVTRYGADGAVLQAAVPLPEQMHLAADSAAGLLVSTRVDVLDLGAAPDLDTPAQPGAATESASAVYRDGAWVPLGPVVAVAGVGSSALVWLTGLRTLAMLDLTVAPAAVPPAPDQPQAGALRLLPSVPGVVLTGPLTLSPDNRYFAAAAVVGNRPRLVVGNLDAARDDTFDVVIVGGELADRASQPAAVWVGSTVYLARPDGDVISYEPASRAASQAALPVPLSATSTAVQPVEPITGLGPG